MQKMLVLGLKQTGRSVLNFYRDQPSKIVAGYAQEISNEERADLAQKFPHAYFYCGELKQVLDSNYFDLLVLSPGFSLYRAEIQGFIKQGGCVTGDVQLWLEYCKQPEQKVIAITGSNGKSTVAELTGFLCSQSGKKTVVAGNIGVPILDAAKTHPDAEVWVLELSSFQLETIHDLNAQAAVCLNISDDHLDRYKDRLDYAWHKDKIFDGARVQVLNQDDPFCLAMQRSERHPLWFSLQEPSNYWLKGTVIMRDRQRLIDSKELHLSGKHNVANVMSALALCSALQLDEQRLIDLLPFFKGLPHRVQKVGKFNDVYFIDDSKGTNVGATLAALRGAPGKVVLIAGGLGKGQSFKPLRKIIEEKVIALFLIGEAAVEIAEVVSNAVVPTVICNSLQEATKKAYAAAKPGDWVLLSPACASMDMFQDYAHRSEVFIDAIRELMSE